MRESEDTEGLDTSTSHPNSEGQLFFETVFEAAYLRKVYYGIRRAFADQLVRDPLDDFPYKSNLDKNIGALRYKIRTGQYRPQAQTIVRAAKKSGMSRPLAFLEIEDQLVLKAICDLLHPRLIGDFPKYVNFGRSNLRTTPPGEPGDYETWFDVWLRHQNLIHQYVFERGANSFLVKADISNFFPSVNLRLLRHAIAAKANCHEKVLDLLFYLLHAMVNRADYAIDYELGLPMENYDASRLLAHFFVSTIDEAFAAEGEQSKYIRWVDDFLIGVETPRDGAVMLGRLQRQLEKRGLSLNATKSSIVKCDAARQDLFPDENAYLDACLAHAKKSEVLPDYDERLSTFLDESATSRRGGWERVLRRFYTTSGRIDSPVLLNFYLQHLESYPGSAPNIVKYLWVQRHTEKLATALLNFLRYDNLHEDVEILIYELLLAFRLDWSERLVLVESPLDHFFGRNGWGTPRHEYVRDLISLLIFKYGDRESLRQICTYFRGSNERHFLRYAYICLYATTDFRQDAHATILSSEDITLRRMAGFLESVTVAPERHAKRLGDFCKPKRRSAKEWAIDARALPVIKILRNTKYRDSGWDQLIDACIKSLNKSKELVRDNFTIKWLQTERERA